MKSWKFMILKYWKCIIWEKNLQQKVSIWSILFKQYFSSILVFTQEFFLVSDPGFYWPDTYPSLEKETWTRIWIFPFGKNGPSFSKAGPWSDQNAWIRIRQKYRDPDPKLCCTVDICEGQVRWPDFCQFSNNSATISVV